MTVTLRVRRAVPRPVRGEADDGRGPRRGGRLLRVSLGVVLVVVLGGCSLLGLGSDSDSGSSDSQDDKGNGTEWFWYQQGDRTPSPEGPALPATGTPRAPVTIYTQAPDQPTASGDPHCLRRLRADTMYWLNATPGVGQASVNWMSLGDPRIVEYKIAAVLQNRPGGSVPPATWNTVAAPSGCQQVNATVTGLLSGSWYVFWLDVVLTTAPTGRREPMIGRSPAFQVL